MTDRSGHAPRPRHAQVAPAPPPPGPTVYYWAVSVLRSRTVWINTLATIVGLLSLADVITLIPPRWLPLYATLVPMLNVILRKLTTRPIAFVGKDTVVPVAVARVGPPPPPLVTD